MRRRALQIHKGSVKSNEQNMSPQGGPLIQERRWQLNRTSSLDQKLNFYMLKAFWIFPLNMGMFVSLSGKTLK